MHLFRIKRSDIWYTLLLVAIVAAIASFVAAIIAIRLIWATTPPDYGVTIPPDYKAILFAAPLASAVLGPSLWWGAIIKPGRLSVRRGIAVGALIGFIAHPVVWYIALVLAFLTRQPTVAGAQVTNPLLDLLTALSLATISLIFAGWLTVLIGGAVGGMIALLQSMSGCRERWRAALSG